MATKRTVSKKTTRAKARTLPLVARAKKRGKAASAPAEDESETRRFHGTLPEMEAFVDRIRAERAAANPPELTFRDMVHDAIEGLEAARRAFDNMRVHEFRGQHDLAKLEDVLFHEELERAFGWLVKLDLEMPEGGAS